LQLRETPYIVIVTIAFAEIIKIIAENLVEVTRGVMGLWGIPPIPPITIPYLGKVIFGRAGGAPDFYLALAIFLGSLSMIYKLVKSKLGMIFVAIREDPDAAESVGLDVTRYKILGFCISAFFVGISGAFYAHYITVITPDGCLSFANLMLAFTATVLGGMSTLFGPVIGIILITFSLEYLRVLGEEAIRFIVYGLLIILVPTFMPEGLLRSIFDALAEVKRLIYTPK